MIYNVHIVVYLIIIKQYILNSFTHGQQIDIVYTNFEKAFDKVNHELLINFVKFYLANTLLSRINSFLCQQNRLIKYKNFISIPICIYIYIHSKDSQGAFLLSFLTYFLQCCVFHRNFNILLFADNAKIYKPISILDDNIFLQKDMIAYNE